ncbi:Ger(x)C family spore germination protein [Anaeroselena agilis]|uniref:Ger(X)C family spore germination protein n=1 Tax=Anaeroselena agilis TaxID=3063788 RepID=A0ABU3P192_9FIRM|nr:Ger(x)C family spore germination protein [Selenomonadales bacterium 4137-cl]
MRDGARGCSPARRAALAACLLAVCLLTAGCWDRVEIQDRAFVLAVAVDVAEEGTDKEPGKAKEESYAHPAPADRFRATFQVLRFGEVKGGQEKPGGESKTFLVTGRGPGMLDAVRDALGESSKGLWFENMQVLLISQKAVERYGLAPVLDFFRRDAEMRGRAQIYITPGEAGKLLAIAPPTGEPGGVFLANIARRHTKDIHLPTARTDISFASQALDNRGDMIFPVVEPAGKSMKAKGGALFKGGKFLGYQDEYFISGLRMIRATEKSTAISFECPAHPGSTVTFELFRHQTVLKPHVEGDRVWFSLDIAMRGNLDEVQCGHKHDTLDPEYLDKAQRLVAEEVERNIRHTLAVSQRLGWEMFYFKSSLKAYKPHDWKRLKDRWDEIYPTVPLEVKVRVSIINVGEHK